MFLKLNEPSCFRQIKLSTPLCFTFQVQDHFQRRQDFMTKFFPYWIRKNGLYSRIVHCIKCMVRAAYIMQHNLCSRMSDRRIGFVHKMSQIQICGIYFGNLNDNHFAMSPVNNCCWFNCDHNDNISILLFGLTLFYCVKCLYWHE